ncbi:hypothetical protein HELRODRAFT_183308 [Helobdella robusta]|uniref:Uncharacterized protein n=1 Tax=Helobdella robusta TaxID=6412 RepID=T1FJF9_HELRO|nr:hypothetical protein HELRODRAFT_183308 [Helobdella robusta]ESO11298.1 hypothetical protein HELRODRAFT_183308 [Helobdella robusta]
MYPFNFHTKRTSFSKSGKLISIKRNRLRDSSFEGLKLPKEFIMEDVRPRSVAWLGYVLFFFLSNLTLRLAPVLEDNIGTGRHSTFCHCRMDSGRISSLAVRLTLRSSDDILCADQMIVWSVQRSTVTTIFENDERWAVVDVSTFQMVVS